MTQPPTGVDYRRRLPRLAVAALVSLAAAAWLAWPRERATREPEAPAIQFVLVDASASATRPRATWSRQVRNRLLVECERAVERGADLCVIRFAADVLVDFGPAPAPGFRAWLEGRAQAPYSPTLTAEQGHSTELDSALALTQEILARSVRPACDVLLLTDGTFTGPDPRARLEALVDAGVGLERSDLSAPDRADLALVDLRIGDKVEVGVPLVAELSLAWAGDPADRPGASGGHARLTLELESETGERWSVSKLTSPSPALADGDGSDRWTDWLELPAPPVGSYILRARVNIADGASVDAMPENDQRSRRIVIGDPLVCLLLTRPERAAALQDVLSGPAFEGISLRPTTFAKLAPDLASADLLVTESIGPADLPRAALVKFVRAGGGWLSLGGYGALRGWEADDVQALAARLPLAIDEPDPSEREVVLFIDGSGSMVGEPFDTVRHAVMELVLGARAADHIQLRFFTGAMGAVVFETRAAERADLQRDLAPLFAAKVPRGPTDVLYALDQLATQRSSSSVRGLVLLVTDGRTLDWFAERSAEVREQLVSSSTDLRIIAVGEDADRKFLDSLLLDGEELDEVTDLQRLQAVFEQRVHAERVRAHDGLLARPVDPASLDTGGVGLDILRAQLSLLARSTVTDPTNSESPVALGQLQRHVPTRARPGAQVLWRTDDGGPLLGLWRVGAGLVAGLGTTPLDGWAPFIAARPSLLSPLVRALGRAAGQGPIQGLQISEDRDELLLEHVPLGAPVEVKATILVRSSAGSAVEALAESDPDRAFSVHERILGSVSMTPPVAGQGLDPRTLRRAARPAFLDRVPSGAALVVEVSGAGEVLGRTFLEPTAPAEFSPGERRSIAWPDPRVLTDQGLLQGPTPDRAPHPATPWLLALGIALATLAAARSG